MEKLQLPHAKLLYFITELFKLNAISEDEKIKLKEKVISSDAKIFDLLEDWEVEQDESKLKEGMLRLASNM